MSFLEVVMKKFFAISFLILSMMIFVSCGDSNDDGPEKVENKGDKPDTEQNDSDTADNGSGNDSDSNKPEDDNTDSGDSANDDESNTPDSLDDADSTDDEDNTDTGDNNEVIDDSNCETVVYKSMDVRKMDVNEIDIWLYDTETYEDYTDPLFFIEAKFAKNVTELKGETISLQDLDPNAENGTLVFFYSDFDASMWRFKKNYIAKSGSFHIEDVDADDYMKLKIDTTAIIFYELAIDAENGVYTEVENGKCYKLEPLEWNSID